MNYKNQFVASALACLLVTLLLSTSVCVCERGCSFCVAFAVVGGAGAIAGRRFGGFQGPFFSTQRPSPWGFQISEH